MALSNWDIFAMDAEGNPCNGKFVSPLGIEVEIYKRWIYVRDKEGGTNSGRPNNTLMQVYESRLNYKDVNIASIFKNYTIYLAVWSGYEDEKNFSGMVGIGSSGVTQKQVERLRKFLHAKSLIYEIDIPKKLAELDLSKGKRFNQGDMFFHRTIGLDMQCTNIGEAKEPHIVKMIKHDMNVPKPK